MAGLVGLSGTGTGREKGKIGGSERKGVQHPGAE